MTNIITQLASLLSHQSNAIASWFASYMPNTPELFYCSVDIRNAGYKCGPVDTNVFPAGFNNIPIASQHQGTKAMREYFNSHLPQVSKVLLIPEAHSRNLAYLDNISIIQKMLKDTGVEILLGSLEEEVETRFTKQAGNGEVLTFYRLKQIKHVVQTSTGFIPDLIILNNDLTTGIPPLLDKTEQKIIPSQCLGWHRRRKSEHFSSYAKVAKDFAHAFHIDDWLISPLFMRCGEVDFSTKQGLECIALNVEKLLFAISEKYKTYGINEEPYVYVKADMGTYGMGITTLRSGKEVFNLNKHRRKDLKTLKGGMPNTQVIIQEGIPTIERFKGVTTETMVYLVNGTPISWLYRSHEQKDAFASLNAPGMHITGFDFDEGLKQDKTRHLLLGLIARLAAKAAALEYTGT